MITYTTNPNPQQEVRPSLTVDLSPSIRPSGDLSPSDHQEITLTLKIFRKNMNKKLT